MTMTSAERVLATDDDLGDVLYQLIINYRSDADVMVVEDAGGHLSIVQGTQVPADREGLCLVVSRRRMQDLAYCYPSNNLGFGLWRRELAAMVRRQGPL
ncbi:hypothetical protein AB0M43_34730 [Longispora sp. NPDC051575]|uniref:hypothetical protein n=1 Tax=Longispora sp. NPDC051575 TaxID=3154943 RepID=UPI003435E5E1